MASVTAGAMAREPVGDAAGADRFVLLAAALLRAVLVAAGLVDAALRAAVLVTAALVTAALVAAALVTAALVAAALVTGLGATVFLATVFLATVFLVVPFLTDACLPAVLPTTAATTAGAVLDHVVGDGGSAASCFGVFVFGAGVGALSAADSVTVAAAVGGTVAESIAVAGFVGGTVTESVADFVFVLAFAMRATSSDRGIVALQVAPHGGRVVQVRVILEHSARGKLLPRDTNRVLHLQ